jgi:hypothetical protein
VVIEARHSEKRCAAFGSESTTDNAAIISALLHTEFQLIGVVVQYGERHGYGELSKTRSYCLFANCADNPLALLIGKKVIQPIVSDCSSRGPFGSDEKIVGIPNPKKRNREELGFRTIAILRGAVSSQTMPNVFVLRQKRCTTLRGIARPSVDLRGRMSGSGAATVSCRL